MGEKKAVCSGSEMVGKMVDLKAVLRVNQKVEKMVFVLVELLVVWMA